ncbi:ABC transporter permease [Elioraea sp. Yellowstone]|jgi:peptide/nickel transport system permease protein|uniref:ABC transporter permease n=1 Tax=Elioraea sp. Yellowstone TaxID=2592070 RepID=UPI00114EC4E1|nr:ABC transporter permease [Elioraea sp. Yellowstone]TQF84820.1 ABC transporter permease [Elioraea sp. Yellowstone]
MTAEVRTEASAQGGLRAWLLAETVTGPGQARAQKLYLGWRRFAANPLALLGLGIVLALVLLAVLAPLVATHDPFAQSLDRRLLPPSSSHLLGTDELGRDIWSRIAYGARITLMIVLLVALIAGPLGLLIGTVAGYLGGWVDVALMRLTDVFLSFPGLILALAFVAALGSGLENAILAIALTAWPPIARLARAETLTVRRADYIAAVRLAGASDLRIIVRHVMPICIPSVIIRITLNMAGIILTAAGLGFLGLGAQPPSPEWGAMLSTGRAYMLGSWWLAAMPGIAILVVSLGFNLLGDALRDVLDPRSS